MNNNKIDRQLNTDELEQVTGGDEISAACGQLAGQVKDKLAKQKIEAKTC